MTKKYTYGNTIHRISKFILLLVSSIYALIGLFFLFLLILSFFNAGQIKPSYTSTLFWNFVGFGIWSPLFFTFLAYLHSDIEVEDEGLKVKFLLKSLFIAWDDIDEFKPGKTFGLLNLKRVRVLVTKNSLTPFHRLYGLMYGVTSKPSLLVGINISDHEELFSIVRNKRKKNIHKKISSQTLYKTQK